MSFCPKCGREIMDESLGCPICSVRDNTRPGEWLDAEKTQGEPQEPVKQEAEEVHKADTFTVEDKDGSKQKFENRPHVGASWGQSPNPQFKEATPVEEKVIPTVLKVIIIVLLIVVSLFFTGFGAIAGLIAGIILMRSPVLDYQKFGKTLTIISGVLLGISAICCVVMTGLISFGVMTDSIMLY